MVSRSLLFLALVPLLAAPAFGGNLFLNPSFESIGADWSYSNVDWWGGWTAEDGSISIDLSGSSAGWIAQTIPTTIGDLYQVSFYLAGNPDGAPAIKQGNVMATGNAAQEFTFNTTGHDNSNMGWTLEAYDFTATASNTTVTFTSEDNTAYGPAIDNVVGTDLGTATPEPATLVIFGSGLLALVSRRKRRSH